MPRFVLGHRQGAIMTPKNKLPIAETLEYVAVHYRYDENTGEFYHTGVNTKNRMPEGAPAGYPCGRPTNLHHNMYILGSLITRARLIWMMHTGSWPVGYIRHKNGNTLDDRFANLYESSQSRDPAKPAAEPRKRIRVYERTKKTKPPQNVEGITYLPRRGVFYVKAVGKYYPDIKTAQRALEAAS